MLRSHRPEQVAAACRTGARGGLWLARVGDETEARKLPALRALTRARLPRLAVAAFGGYDTRLLSIPGGFLFPRAPLRDRRTSRVRSGASVCPGVHGGAAADRGAARHA